MKDERFIGLVVVGCDPNLAPVVALSKVDYIAEVIDTTAKVTIRQVYQNLTNEILETQYRFPMDENACIAAFSARFGDKELTGLVKNREQARQDYQDAVRERKRTALMEQDKANEFTAYIGNIPAQSECVITISYVATLDQTNDKTSQFYLPLALLNRYNPQLLLREKEEEEDCDLQTVCRSLQNHCNIVCDGCDDSESNKNAIYYERFHCTVCSDYDLCRKCYDKKDVHDPTHRLIRLDANGRLFMPKKYHVRPTMKFSMDLKFYHLGNNIPRQVLELIQSGTTFFLNQEINDRYSHIRYESSNLSDKLTSNFILSVVRPANVVPRLSVETSANSPRIYQLIITPPEPLSLEVASTSLKAEFIFLLDQSGSMFNRDYKSQNLPIEAVKYAMNMIVTQLPTTCKFNIVGFGDSSKRLFNKSQMYTETSVEQARTYLQNLENMGGTEIMTPLKDVLSDNVSSTYPRQVFLLTDGQVQRVDAIVKLVQKYRHNTRLFTFGIGTAVDRSLVKRLAEAGNGEAAFIDSIQNMNSIVTSQVNCSFQRSLCNLQIDWGVSNVIQVPKVLPLIFPNMKKPIVVYAMINESEFTKGEGHTIMVRDDQGKQVMEIPYATAQIHENAHILEKLAAREWIREIESNEEKFTNEDKAAIADVALKYQIMSSQTSFILVDHDNKNQSAELTMHGVQTGEDNECDELEELAFRSSSSNFSSSAAVQLMPRQCVMSLSAMECQSESLSSNSATFMRQSRSITPSVVSSMVGAVKSFFTPSSSSSATTKTTHEPTRQEIYNTFMLKHVPSTKGLYIPSKELDKALSELLPQSSVTYKDIQNNVSAKFEVAGKKSNEDHESLIQTMIVWVVLHKSYPEKYEEWKFLFNKSLGLAYLYVPESDSWWKSIEL